MLSPELDVTDLSTAERSLAGTLLANRGRVLTRTMLAKDLGIRIDQSRRVDSMLVNVRRELNNRGMEVVNVRSRGWMVLRES
jgi:DNA-binding response OmpR family regulator